MKRAIVVFLLLSIWACPALSYFTYTKGEERSSSSLDDLSFGKDIPLDIAVKMLIPKGWSVTLPSGFSFPVVSWEGDLSWEENILEITTQAGAECSVDHSKKRVSITTRSWAPKENEWIVQVGRGPVEGISSEGENTPLHLAIEEITPDGWKVLYDPKVSNPERKVSWSGVGRPWIEVLGQLAKEQGVKLAVNHESKKVFVFSNQRTDVQVAKLGVLLEKEAELKKSKEPTLAIKKDVSLKLQLEKQVQAHGYVVEWEYPTDIRLRRDLSMFGPFKDCLREIVQSLREEGGFRIGMEFRTKSHPIVIVVKEI